MGQVTNLIYLESIEKSMAWGRNKDSIDWMGSSDFVKSLSKPKVYPVVLLLYKWKDWEIEHLIQLIYQSPTVVEIVQEVKCCAATYCFSYFHYTENKFPITIVLWINVLLIAKKV